ncbi:MAG: T9SS type A sorting domain-containing protein, partial [Bacteroidota bacterium]
GCSTQLQTNIQQPDPLTCDYLVTQQGCGATNEYNACPTVSGGVPPYTYLWKNNNITQCLQSDDLQDFLLTITDANGCSIVQAPTDVVTTDALKITIVGKTNVQCFDGTDGQIDLQVEGGTLPYTFQWSNGEETQDLQGLPAGTYFLTVTDAKGCSGQWQTDIQQPEPLTCDYLVTQQGCGATNEYNACPTISGGVPPYTYLWKNNNITQCLQSDDLEDFLLTITDANGCSIVQAPTDVVTTDALQITIVRKTNVQCFDGTDGQINLQVEGGTLPYTFQWSNGEETQDLQGLPAGTYFLTVTDAEGCSGQWQTDIQQPEPLTCDYLVTQQGCGATNDYNACPTVSGGVPPYTYLWKNNNITQCLQSDDLQDFLLTITDANGCSIVQAPTDVVATDALQIAIVRATNVQCFDGTDGQIDLQVEGGTLPYTFQWSNGEETQDLRGLAAGTYSVTVTDGGGCSAQTSRTLEQPTRLTCDYKVLQSSCNGLIEYSACPEVSGGVQPYRYEWLDGSNEQCLKSSSLQEFVLSITDANDCNIVKPPSGLIEKLNLIVLGNTTDVQCFGGSDGSIDLQGIGGTPPYAFRWAGGQETTSLKDLSVGDYLVTLTDAEGCSAVGSFSVEQPDRLSIEEQVTQASSGSLGAIQTQVNGGVPPYQYLWSNNENSQNVEGLEAGTYQLTVTDANGCTHTKAFEISFTVSSQEVSKVEAYLQIFPNPGKGLFNIRTDETFSATQWQVYNASGSLIQEEAFIPSGQQLNLSHLPSGLYLVRLQNQAGQMRSSQLVILP